MKVNFNKPFVDCFGKEVVNEKTGKGTNIAESLCMVIFNLNNVGAPLCLRRRNTSSIRSAAR